MAPSQQTPQHPRSVATVGYMNSDIYDSDDDETVPSVRPRHVTYCSTCSDEANRRRAAPNAHSGGRQGRAESRQEIEDMIRKMSRDTATELGSSDNSNGGATPFSATPRVRAVSPDSSPKRSVDDSIPGFLGRELRALFDTSSTGIATPTENDEKNTGLARIPRASQGANDFSADASRDGSSDPLWSQFTSIMNKKSDRQTLDQFQALLESVDSKTLRALRGAGGQTLLHAAAEMDQGVFALLLFNEGFICPSLTDKNGKTALDLATNDRTRKLLSGLQAKSVKRKERVATNMQARVRGNLSRKLNPRDSCSYQAWLPLVSSLLDMEFDNSRIPKFLGASSFMELKQESEFVICDELDEVGEAIPAQDSSFADTEQDSLEDMSLVTTSCSSESSSSSTLSAGPVLTSVSVTANVVKWTRSLKDERLQDLFRKRLQQLAQGERSKTLCKRLEASDRLIYEAKLDAGQRIIWTPWQGGILIWFVCKHDNISRCVERVNISYDRVLEKQQESGDAKLTVVHSASDIEMEAQEPEMLASPLSNTPLKIHSLKTSEIDRFVKDSDWTPPIKLTAQEEAIVSQGGTVLVLGRSGTGKTLCVCSRIDRDRGEHVRQLFVARTKHLCNFVENMVKGTTAINENLEFKQVVNWVEDMRQQYDDGESGRTWKNQSRFLYLNFCNHWDEIRGKEKNLDPLVVWTQIRSFIKGSYEAAIKQEALTEEEYMSFELLSKNRCRLSEEDRRRAYACFKRYQSLLNKKGLWDDMDRVIEVVRLFKANCRNRGLLYDKIYVDEVQDMSQAEIGLLFLASGNRPDSLFLAGDPAQAVAQGVDFRFEEVRSVVHMIFEGREKIERWQKLYHNFRSHEGILKVANSVLDCLLKAFPEAALKLEHDTGLVQGPRPGLLTSDYKELPELLRKNERIRVLVRDDSKAQFLEHVPGFEYAVYGIIEAKGLEFSDVIIVDFFSGCKEKKLQKAWKNLLVSSISDISSSAAHHSSTDNPQALELEIKLLYTAITRAQNRLLFIETKGSDAYEAWNRLMCGRLAEPMKMDTIIQESSKLMTSDEWRAQGIDLVIAVDEDSDDALSNLKRAIAHFEKADDPLLVARVRKHLSALKLQYAAREIFLEDPDSADAIELATQSILSYVEAGLVEEASVLCTEFCSSSGLTGLAGRIKAIQEIAQEQRDA